MSGVSVNLMICTWPLKPTTFSLISFLNPVRMATATNMIASPSAMEVTAITTKVQEKFSLPRETRRFARNNSVFN